MSLYLQPTQSREGAPNTYELQLANAIEQVFTNGAQAPEQLAAGLNELDVPGPEGEPWTVENFTAEMARLGK
ncbi:recombinase-like helix-turn-helix domain-containing protein [Corynebacterium halotolerans]|uniref:recombinase-like helix-turn-helix domain-containing protein n=1 Tax=Corynebacterium halotolerans TaxID=225326 RepID=UPI003CF2C284